jgi:hypothetical protein
MRIQAGWNFWKGQAHFCHYRYTPYSTEQEIISADQGILARDQGISSAKTEIITR